MDCLKGHYGLKTAAQPYHCHRPREAQRPWRGSGRKVNSSPTRPRSTVALSSACPPAMLAISMPGTLVILVFRGGEAFLPSSGGLTLTDCHGFA